MNKLDAMQACGAAGGAACEMPAATTHKPSLWARLVQYLKHGFMTLYMWQRRVNDRCHLSEMDQRLLDDIGISRADAEAEAAKAFWRP